MENTWSHRPEKHVERDQIVTWLDQHHAALAVRPVLAGLADGFRSTSEGYLAAVAANNVAGVDATLAIRALADAERAFDAAFRRWLGIAEAYAGPLTRVLAPVLGDRTPYKFLTSALAPKVYVLDDLFAHVEKLPELQVDPRSWEGLQITGRALGRAKEAADLALEVRARAVRALAAATAAFDRLYGGIVKTVRLLDPTLAADLPRFRRPLKAGSTRSRARLAAPLDAPSTAPVDAVDTLEGDVDEDVDNGAADDDLDGAEIPDDVAAK